MAYLVKVRPHKEKISNRLQLFNDGCLLFVAALLFAFYFMDEYSPYKFQFGWTFIAIMLINVFVNITLAFFLAIRNCRQNCGKKKVNHKVSD